MREKQASKVDRSIFVTALGYAHETPDALVHVYTRDADVYWLFENTARILKRTNWLRQSDALNRIQLHDSLSADTKIIPYDKQTVKDMRAPLLTTSYNFQNI
jgi:hypothetical protein